MNCEYIIQQRLRCGIVTVLLFESNDELLKVVPQSFMLKICPFVEACLEVTGFVTDGHTGKHNFSPIFKHSSLWFYFVVPVYNMWSFL